MKKASLIMSSLKSEPGLVRSLTWFGTIGVFTALMLSALAQNNGVGMVWLLVAATTFGFLVVRTNLKDLANEVRAKFAAEEANMRKEQETQKQKAAQQSAETAQYRIALTPDIRACLADTQYSGWFWANQSTLERLYLNDGSRKVMATICLTSDMRVIALEVKDSETDQVTRLENKPYLLMKRAERAEANLPVDQFLDNALPGATWTWGDVEAMAIWVTAERFGPNPCKAQLHLNRNKVISSMKVTLPDGTVKQVNRRGGKPVVTASQPQETAKPAEKPKRLPSPTGANRSGLGTTILVRTESEPEQKPAEAPAASAAETTEHGTLLDPTDEPDLSVEQIQQSVEQIRRALSDEYAERAEAAASGGQNSFTAEWPEGIQTQIEAEYLVQAFIDSKVYCKGTVDAKQQTLQLFFQQA